MDKNREIPPGLREIFERDEESIRRTKRNVRSRQEMPSDKEPHDLCTGSGCSQCGFTGLQSKKKSIA